MAKRDFYEILGVAKTVSEDDLKKGVPQKSEWNTTLIETLEMRQQKKNLRKLLKRMMCSATRINVLAMTALAMQELIIKVVLVVAAKVMTWKISSNVLVGVFGNDDIFGEFFGGGRRGQQRGTGERGSNLRIKVKLTLEEVNTGVNKKINLKKQNYLRHL